MSSSRIGRQEPRIQLIPERFSSDGIDAASFASAYGITPDEWQANILDVWLGRDRNDKFTATTCGLSVPRQNGKNAVLEMRELYGLCIIGETILHTAHEVKTAEEAFRRLAAYFENDEDYPELAEMLSRVRRTNGKEAIELVNGASIRFSARSRGASRGMTFDLCVFDECQELTDEQLEAVMSTMSAAPLGNRQQIFTGTPPSLNSPGEVFGRLRESALLGNVDDLAWHEWSVEEVGDVHDRDRWYETNPALGIRLDEKFTETECSTLTAEGFARERLGWWQSVTGAAVVRKADWEATRVGKEDIPDGKKAIGVKFSVDGSTVSVAIAVKPEHGTPYVELLHEEATSRGIQWLADELLESTDKIAVIVIDGVGNAVNLADKLLDRSGENHYVRQAICLPTSNQVAAASSGFHTAIIEHAVTHWNDEYGAQDILDNSVLTAKKRSIGTNGNWGWDGNDPTPVEAVSLALWGVKNTRRNPAKKARLL